MIADYDLNYPTGGLTRDLGLAAGAGIAVTSVITYLLLRLVSSLPIFRFRSSDLRGRNRRPLPGPGHSIHLLHALARPRHPETITRYLSKLSEVIAK